MAGVVMNVGLEAVLSPTIDDDDVKREIDRIERDVDDLQLGADVDTGGIGDGVGDEDDGGVAGALSGRGGISTTGTAGAGSAIAAVGKSAIPVALAGTVAFGLLRGIQTLAGASPALEKSLSMMDQAMELYMRPFGDLINQALEPFAKDFLKGGQEFFKTAKEEGIDVAIVEWATEFPEFGVEGDKGPLNQGDTGGGILGAGIGTVAGFALGGPLGALAGGVAGATLGDIVGQIMAGEFGMDDLEQLGTQSMFAGGMLVPGTQPAVGAGRFVGRKIGEVIGLDDFDWGEYVDGLDWTDFVPVLRWAEFVGGLGETVGDVLGDLNPVGTAGATTPGGGEDEAESTRADRTDDDRTDFEQERREQRRRERERRRESEDFEHEVGGDTGNRATGPFAGTGTTGTSGFEPPGERLTDTNVPPDVEERFPDSSRHAQDTLDDMNNTLQDIRDNTDDSSVGGDTGRRATGPYAEAVDSRPFVEMVEDGQNTYSYSREVNE